jgi:hypothetical protein
MKTPMTFIMFAMMAFTVEAQNNNNNQYSKGAKCETTLESTQKTLREQEKEAGTTPSPLVDCENYKVLSIMNGNEDIAANTMVTTMDGKIPCRQDGGYTMDYKDCKRVMNLYNSVVLAEQAMFATQKIILNESNIKQQKDIAAATAKGDLQYGAIEAVIARNDINAKMYKTQAATYSGAVTALSGGLVAWGGKKSLAKMCKKKINEISPIVATDIYYKGKEAAAETFTYSACEKIANAYKEKQSVFANENSKARFIAELATYTQKALEAMRLAGLSEKEGKRDPTKIGNADEETIAFDPCLGMNPPPECKEKGPRNITPGSFGAGATQFGGGGGANQDFNFDPEGISGLTDETAATGTDGEKIADIGSPFEAAAREANGILDPAGKAVVSPGGGNQGGGAGGGPGGGGGGSASLSDDPGAEDEASGDPEIKTNKISGKYKAGGGGFGSVGKGGKDDANPFASMFDAKGESGGIEEDRSIASDSGEGSGLFHKISKKYGQVHQEKRLDSQNLE